MGLYSHLMTGERILRVVGLDAVIY
jgi:hypothetical protein